VIEHAASFLNGSCRQWIVRMFERVQAHHRPHARHHNGLALDDTEGERIARVMQGRNIAFLGNHGVMVCGVRIDHAYENLSDLWRT
jgi:ribulose-5-phosphate 4-epimerase/fuculose-1-phosphate aldolase